MRLQSRIMLRPSRSKKNLGGTDLISSFTRSYVMVDNDQPDIDKAVCDADTGA